MTLTLAVPPDAIDTVADPANDAPLEDAALNALDHLVERALFVAGKVAG